MISRDKVRKMLNINQNGRKYTDEEIKMILDWVYMLVKIECKINSGIKEK